MSDKVHRLDRVLAGYGRVMVAYSGGVDSAFLLERAHAVLGAHCLGVIADSPSLARAELSAALELARRIGARVDVVRTHEFANPEYLANTPDRCYFCKAELFGVMERLAAERGFPVLAYGENADDMRQVRPGRRAAEEFEVVAPLRDVGLGKEEIRVASRAVGLPTAEKPASPCLSSRIPHGTPVTLEALGRVERGEAALRDMGFRVFRVRDHGELARVELGPEEFGSYDDPAIREGIERALRAAGYGRVERDPNPYGAGRAP
ncbi:MAG: ATP-dependent sacrificial sulfur transferase LarE [Verrucomicrobiae bacterium]|nr:ATP-dependent sacrificial sulfur transferase LarE [Verrucomicrobiae bacterium]